MLTTRVLDQKTENGGGVRRFSATSLSTKKFFTSKNSKMKRRKSGNYTNCKHLFAQLFDNAQNDKDKSKKRTSLRKMAGKMKTAEKTKTVSDTGNDRLWNAVANTDCSKSMKVRKNSATSKIKLQKTTNTNDNDSCNESSSETAVKTRIWQQSIFAITAEPPPTCELLTKTCEVGLAKWRGALQQFNRERKWYNQQYSVNYNPPIWRWVANDT